MDEVSYCRETFTPPPLLPNSLETFDTVLNHVKYTDGDNYNDPVVLDGYLTLLGNDFRAKTMCLQHISQKYSDLHKFN